MTAEAAKDSFHCVCILLTVVTILHRAVVPIGACYAGTLWLGNAAYLYLSVSFIQMLKVYNADRLPLQYALCIPQKQQAKLAAHMVPPCRLSCQWRFLWLAVLLAQKSTVVEP